MFNEHAEGFGGAIPDLTAPSKEALIHLLRNESKWPEGFEFNFQNCTKCAMGLAQAVWPHAIKDTASQNVGDAIGISRDIAHRIFQAGGGAMDLSRVTAADVADMLEAV